MEDFTEIIFAGEVPPDQMYKLLTDKWGVGENLAFALMNHFGGHIYDTYRAIEELSLMKEKFIPGYVYGPEPSTNIDSCLYSDCSNKKWSDEKKLQMIQVLTGLAIKGFCPILGEENKENEVFRKLSLKNIGGVVSKNGLIVGLNKEVWKGKYFKLFINIYLDYKDTQDTQYGIIPCKQSRRLLIARELARINMTSNK